MRCGVRSASNASTSLTRKTCWVGKHRQQRRPVAPLRRECAVDVGAAWPLSVRSESRHLAGRLGIDSGAGNVGVACQQGRGSPRAAVSTLPTSRLAAISRSNVPQSNSRFSMIRLSDSLSGLIVLGKVALLGWPRVIHSTSARTVTGVGHR